ncbi:CoA-disulfide reductase [Alkalibacillus flavidus]|uniref:CoA-disulfide reductase n=1 Tax=Alkalibacillus flavidus TaxID=546021 RepID=A0ABV2KTI2_9BACI
MSNKIVIVGGVAGGATAAARLRRLDEESEIIVFERGEYISFANCGLPYYIGETIQDRDNLLVQTVEGMSQRYQLDIRNQTEVTSIDRTNQMISAKHMVTGEVTEESYDYLILSPGAKPIVPPIPGIEDANIFTLRNIPDTDRIKGFVDHNQPSKAVVIGGGFIGLEMAENLVDRGIDVTVLEKASQVMGPIDPEMAAVVHQELRDKGINLVLENGVQQFEQNGQTIILEDSEKITTDMVILSIGVRPESNLASEAGLSVGERGGIIVNDQLQTSDEHIYALGDAVEVKDYSTGQPIMVPLAWPANRQGRIVANNIYGKNETYPGTLGTSIVKVFDYTVAATGLNEKRLQHMNMPYQAVHIHPGSHAGYYPGATPLVMKLLFNQEDGHIYGAQIVGQEGVDKRIDVLATAIKGGLTVKDLPDLELAYAPPFSSAKDPVNMLGYVATNIMEGDIETIQWHDATNVIRQGDYLVDVREPDEVEHGTVPGAINIPLDELRDRLDELPQDRVIHTMCQAGLRGYLATKILTNHGYTARNLDGGWKTYSIAYNLS